MIGAGPVIDLETGAGLVAIQAPWGQVFHLPTAGARLWANAMMAAADTADAAASLEARVAGAGQSMLAAPVGRA